MHQTISPIYQADKTHPVRLFAYHVSNVGKLVIVASGIMVYITQTNWGFFAALKGNMGSLTKDCSIFTW